MMKLTTALSEPCENGGTCHNDGDDDTYSCTCQNGFRGDRCVENIDECAEDSQLCKNNGDCEDTFGSFT